MAAPSPVPPTGNELPAGRPADAPSDHVSQREKFAYGLGGLPSNFGEAGLKTLAVPIYQMILKVDPALLGLMMALPRLIDAFTDPLMGHISDRTRTRWGRRRPYIFAGAALTCVSFVLVWMVPPDWSQGGKLAWFFITSALFYLCNTVWAVPYQSLGYEITPDYNERTRVMGIQSVFYLISGFVIQWMLPVAQLAIFPTVMQGVQVVTVVAAVAVFLIAGSVPALFVRERFARAAPVVAAHGFKFWAGCRAVWQNRGMRILAGLALLQSLAAMLSGSLDYYLIVYYMFKGDLVQGSIWKGVLSSAYAAIAFFAIWPVMWFSQRFDKRVALTAIYGLAIAGGLMKWVLFNPNHPWLLLLDPLLSAPVYVGLSVLVPSMTADICDEDELTNGERREGLFGAMLSWIRKSALSLAFLGSGLTLNLVGFNAALGGHQDPATILSLRLTLSLTPSIAALGALFLLTRYHLNRERATAIRTELEARRGAAV